MFSVSSPETQKNEEEDKRNQEEEEEEEKEEREDNGDDESTENSEEQERSEGEGTVLWIVVAAVSLTVGATGVLCFIRQQRGQGNGDHRG